MTAADRIYLLAIDLRTAPEEVRSALHIDRDELTVLLDRARLRLGNLELVVVSTPERMEMYGAEPSWHWGFQELLREAKARGRGVQGFGSTRVTEKHGVDVARHLMRLAAGLESHGSASLGALHAVDMAAQAARLAHTLGDDLSTLFTCAASAGMRAHNETSLSRIALDAVDEVDIGVPEVERIVEEELAGWQAWCARDERCARAESPSSSEFPAEAQTSVRPKRSRQSVA